MGWNIVRCEMVYRSKTIHRTPPHAQPPRHLQDHRRFRPDLAQEDRPTDRCLWNSSAKAENLVLLGPNGMGKAMLSKKIADQAVLPSSSVRFRAAAELLDDAQCDSPERRRRESLPTQVLTCSASTRSAAFPNDHTADLLYKPSIRALLEARDGPHRWSATRILDTERFACYPPIKVPH
jgi:hypothetical protein